MLRFMTPVYYAILLTLFASSVFAGDLPVLFDQGHNQRFLISKEGPLQLSGLAGIFKDQGLSVAPHEGATTREALAGSSAFVVSGAFNSFTSEETDAIVSWVENGGRLAIMLHIGSPLVSLMDRLGVVVSSSVIHEKENLIKTEDINFTVKRIEPDPLTSGIEQFSIYGGWALLNDGLGTVALAKTGDKAWIDLNGDKKLSEGDAVQSFNVIVSGNHGQGRFVVFADDAIFQNQYLDENNSRLAVNLANWLK